MTLGTAFYSHTSGAVDILLIFLKQPTMPSELDHAYSPLHKDSIDTNLEKQDLFIVSRRKGRVQCFGLVFLLCLVFLLTGLYVFKFWDFLSVLKVKLDQQSTATEKCTSPVLRPSWNKMSHEKKKRYIDAVLCLAKRPSHIHSNSTVYDDFTYIHIDNGLRSTQHEP